MKLLREKTPARQAGFALIEVLLALVISGVLGISSAAIANQTLQQNNRSSQQMQAMQEVENAGYWLSRDVLAAQTVTPGAAAGFPLVLAWQDWEAPIQHQVIYAITGDKIQRSVYSGGLLTGQTIIARNINTNTAFTNSSFEADILTFNITATVRTHSESRSYQIKTRPGSAQ